MVARSLSFLGSPGFTKNQPMDLWVDGFDVCIWQAGCICMYLEAVNLLENLVLLLKNPRKGQNSNQNRGHFKGFQVEEIVNSFLSYIPI